MDIRALVLKITGFDIRGPASTLNESRQKTDQTVVADGLKVSTADRTRNVQDHTR